MALAPAELAAQLATTRAFINGDATTVVPHATLLSSDGAGGELAVDGPAKEAVRVRLVPTRDGAEELSTSDGRRVVPSYKLTAMPQSSISRFDKFTAFGSVWQIAAVHAKPEYILKADVVLYG